MPVSCTVTPLASVTSSNQCADGADTHLAGDLLAGGRGWFERAAVERLLDDHVQGRADNGHRLWTLTMLELWRREHVESPVRKAA